MKEEHDISEVVFKTWVLRLSPYYFEEDTLYVTYDIVVAESYMNKKFQYPLKTTISEFLGKEIEVIILSMDEISNNSVLNKSSESSSDNNSDIYIQNLNPKYTFDTFVVGTNNEYAHATSLAVAEDPGEYGNPLFIYGGSGLGKTHLMHSIAHHVLKKNKNLKILYVTSEDFTNELITSIKNKNQENFKEKYRNTDMLLVDDIQFMVGKESTQEEFFHTFNTLYERKKQIVISSDKPPKDIEGLEERLISRFKVGLTVDVQPPNYETRVAILKNKTEIDHMEVDMDSLHYIAENVNTNIRELEGALNQVNNYAHFHNIDKIELETVENALRNFINPDKHKVITLDLILSIVADHYGVEPSALKGKRRNSEIVGPRQVFMYLAKKYTDNSLQSIGDFIGGKDHTTVSYGADRIEEDIKKDERLKSNIDIIVKKLNPN